MDDERVKTIQLKVVMVLVSRDKKRCPVTVIRRFERKQSSYVSTVLLVEYYKT